MVRLHALWDDLVLIWLPVIGALAWYLREPALFFEYIFASLAVYIFLSWTQIPKSDLAKVKAYVAGGEVEMPLIHKDSDWVPASIMPYFDETGRPIPSKDSSS